MNKKELSEIAIRVGVIIVVVSGLGFTFINLMAPDSDSNVRWLSRLMVFFFGGALILIFGLILKAVVKRQVKPVDPNKPAWAE